MSITAAMNDRDSINEREAALEAWRKRMKADRAWAELAVDQFQPHSQVSMNTWMQARQNLAESSLFFEFTYQQRNDSL
jgi:hypothetical protein